MSDLSDLALDALKTLGGRAPAWQIAEHVAAQLDAEDYRDITRNGFIAQVRNALRTAGGNGLPSAVSVDREYVQTAILSVAEYQTVYSGYIKRGVSNFTMADRFADECEAVHGVRPDGVQEATA